jgi:predicted PurR-regulated permease PerM
MPRQAAKKVGRKKLPDVSPKGRDLVLHDFARYFFVLVVVVVMGMFFWIISPFFNILVYSGLIAVIFYPVHKWFLSRLGGHFGYSAFFSTVLVVLVVITPLILFTIFLVQQALDAYALATREWTYDLTALKWDGLQNLPIIGDTIFNISDRFGLADMFSNVRIDLVQTVRDISEGLTNFLVSQSTNIVKSVSDVILKVFILVLTTFFFFKDGKFLVDFLKTISPLPNHYETDIGNKLRNTTYAIVVGNFGTSLVQGILACIGFLIAGVHNAVFWATLLAFAALIPYIGSAFIWIPISAALFLQGDLFQAGFVAVWGIVIVSTVDNIIRPWFIGSGSDMHPLATFLVVLGAIFVFGIKGIIFGPLILSLTVTILHIYRLEYQDMLKD